jgi:hypothetical protein
MNRIRWCVLLALGSQLLLAPIAVGQTTHVIEAPNFLGRNVCMKIETLAVPGSNYPQQLFPNVQTEAELGHREPEYARSTKHTIRVGTLGSISIDEELAADSTCTNLPLNDFVWNDDQDGLRSTARFCLTGVDGKRKIHVRGSVSASAADLARVKKVLVNVAACRMTSFPSEHDSRDVFSNKEQLLVGPQIFAR